MRPILVSSPSRKKEPRICPCVGDAPACSEQTPLTTGSSDARGKPAAAPELDARPLWHWLWLWALVVLTVLGSHVPASAYSVSLESDALALPLRGYSGILRVSHDNGLNYALGTGRYTLPELFVRGQSSDARADWRATAESIQVLRIGYRFFGPRRNGPALDVILINQLWRLQAQRLDDETHFKTLGTGISAGYYLHIGPHFYAYPTASLTYDRKYAGSSTVQGESYEVRPVGFAGSLHLGWEL